MTVSGARQAVAKRVAVVVLGLGSVMSVLEVIVGFGRWEGFAAPHTPFELEFAQALS